MNRPKKKANRSRWFRGLCVGGVCLFALLAEMFPPARGESRDVSIEVLESELVYSKRISPYYNGSQAVAAYSGKIESDDNKAVLTTDPEQERTLERAEEFAKQREYRWAVVLWQSILDQSATSMVTRKDWEYVVREYDDNGSFVYQKYRSVSEEVENILANLPAGALKQYRVRYDGKAAELIAAAPADAREDALAQIVRKYFISSRGDNAAFELACRKMDRGEFLGAARLLDRVVNRYPDSEIPKDELLRRLAAAQARIGDLKAARETLAKLAKNPGQSQRWLAILKQDIDQAAQYVAAGGQDQSPSWPLALGGANRRGTMKAPVAIGSERGLTELWSRQIDLGFTSSSDDSSTSQRLSERRTPSVYSDGESTIEYSYVKSYVRRPYYPSSQTGGAVISEATGYADVISRWKQNGWTPAGQVLMDGNRLYFKDRYQLICIDAESSRLLWRSFLKNEFLQDQLSKQLAAFNAAIGNGRQPRNPLDVQLFGDLIHGEMSIANGLIFNIEGKLLNNPDSKDEKHSETTPTMPTYGYGRSPVFHRSRRNQLTAYDAVTGKLKWHRTAEVVDGGDPNAQVGFLGAPVPYGRLLIAPVSDAGVIWALGIDQKTGATVWKTRLCDDPSNGANPWAPVRIAVDGGDAYIPTGAGVVFSLDATSGAIRWGFRYTRRGRKNPYIAQRYGYYGGTTPGNTLLQVVGMREDAVIPHRQTLVVMASDHDRLFAINRRTGGLMWESPLEADSKNADGQTFWPEYCVGVYGDGLFVAGRRVVRRYNINGGGIEWQRKLDTVEDDAPASFGRGIVTDDGVYIPVRDSILKLAHTAETGEGRVIGQYGVVLEGRQPVGNIYSDGDRLYVLGPGHLSALGSIKGRLKALDRKVEAGDLSAQLERMRLRGRLGDFGSAIADLKEVIKKLSAAKPGATANHEAIADVLVRAIADLQLPAAKPLETLRLLQSGDSLFARPFSNTQHKESLLTQREELVFNALQALLEAKTNPGAEILLRSAGLFNSPRLSRTARKALPNIVNAADRDRLLAAASSKNVQARRLAIAGLSGLPDKTALPPLKSALKDPEVSVRIDAAVALAKFDNRDGLPVLVDLLESKQLETRITAIRYLSRMTGQRFQFVAYDTGERRTASVKRWREWLKGEGRTARLKQPGDKPVLIGHLLVADPSHSRVVEYDKDRKVIHQASFAGASAVARIENGHWWAASYSTSRIAEFDAKGNQIRSINCARWGQPYSLHITETGTILTAMYSQNKVVEFDRDGKYVREFKVTGYATDAQRLENGNTLVAVYQSSGQFIEYDPKGNIVRRQTGLRGPWSVQRLDSGHTLVAEYDAARVTEYDARGSIVWSKTGLPNPLDARRDDKGNTLIIHNGGLCEVDRKGNVLWQISGGGMRRAIRF